MEGLRCVQLCVEHKDGFDGYVDELLGLVYEYIGVCLGNKDVNAISDIMKMFIELASMFCGLYLW